jgi:hypothetical protein
VPFFGLEIIKKITWKNDRVHDFFSLFKLAL